MYHIYSIKYCHVYKIFHDSSAAFIYSRQQYLFATTTTWPQCLFKLAFNQINKVKQLDIMLPCVCSVVDHRRCQIVVRTSVTYCTTIKFLSPFNIICHLLLNRRTATQNLLVHQNNAQAQCTCGLVYWALTSITNILAHRSL